MPAMKILYQQILSAKQPLQRILQRGLRMVLGASGFSLPWLAMADQAKADLVICSRKINRHMDVAIGYREGNQWVSRGWWKLPPSDCVTPVSGDINRYYYIRTVEWGTGIVREQNYNFCVTSDAFTIVGDTNCQSRGYEEKSFFQYDCGGNSFCQVTIWPEKVSFAPSPVDGIVAQHLLHAHPRASISL